MSKIFEGEVVSTKMAKTIVAVVTHQYKHPLYKKILRKTKKYKIHCVDSSQLKIGDKVKFIECKPMSKDKRYIVKK